jgi:predicted nucleic-acid-binding protein
VIGLDTNVLVRYFGQDDAQQSPRADAILDSLTAQDPGWVGLAAVLELVWVMTSVKHANRAVVADTLDQLLAMEAIVVEQASTVVSAVHRFRWSKADFADCLIAASAQTAGCNRTLTFDRIAARDAGMELIS